jgi:hypothetical protein
MKGEEPKQIDHKNGVPTDNRWINLRGTTHGGNQRNRKVNVNSKTGVAGVYVDPRSGKYRAQISVNGSRISLGTYETLKSAADARAEAQRRYGFAPEHGTR